LEELWSAVWIMVMVQTYIQLLVLALLTEQHDTSFDDSCIKYPSNVNRLRSLIKTHVSLADISLSSIWLTRPISSTLRFGATFVPRELDSLMKVNPSGQCIKIRPSTMNIIY